MPRRLAPSPERAPQCTSRPCSQHRLAHGREPHARATYPELQRGGGQHLFVLAVQVGGRNDDSPALVRQLVRVRAFRAPLALSAAASTAWMRRCWGMLSTTCCTAVVSNGAAGCEPAFWTTRWRSLSQLPRAASRCAERGTRLLHSRLFLGKKLLSSCWGIQQWAGRQNCSLLARKMALTPWFPAVHTISCWILPCRKKRSPNDFLQAQKAS